MLVGGICVNFDGSYRLGAGRDFVIEGDEYDSAFFDKTAKFLKYLPDIAVVGNLEYDHADIYPDMEALRVAFRRFVGARAAQRAADPRRRQSGGHAARARGAVRRWRRSACRRTPTGAPRTIQAGADGVVFELTVRGERLGHVSAAALRRAQRAERAGRDRGRRGGGVCRSRR